MPAIKNFRDVVGETLAASRKATKAALQRRLGPPPAAVAQRAQKDDEYRAFFRLGPGWEDPAQHQAKAAAMYAQGAKPSDVLTAMYPDRAELLVLGDRRDNLPAQVAFTEAMVAKHFETLAGTLKEQQAVLEKRAGGNVGQTGLGDPAIGGMPGSVAP